MATFVLGDVHGQLAALERLLARLRPDPARDRLWLVGDLVSRGPDSLGVLRKLRRMSDAWEERMAVVLGNHDLRLLAFAEGIGEPKPRDLLDEVLAAPDRDELCGWLRTRPLFHRRGGDVMVHAGLAPAWTPAEAERLAREAEEVLRGGGSAELLADWRSGEAVDEPARERRRRTLAVLTGIRTCTEEGDLCDWSGPPEGAPAGCLPWFRYDGRRNAGVRVVFGHWAALGLRLEERVKALDSGAAWGGRLTALRLEDRVVFQEPVHQDDRAPSVMK